MLQFPRTHEDRAHIKTIQELDAKGEIESVKVQVVNKKFIPTRSSKKLYEITIQDEHESQAVISLFNNPRAFKSYTVGQRYILTGKVVYEYNKIIFRHPDATKVAPPDSDGEGVIPLPDSNETQAIDSPLHMLEKNLYTITKNNKYHIQDDNLLYLEFLKKELSDQEYTIESDTDRSLVVVPS